MMKKFATRESEEKSIFESQRAYWAGYYEDLDRMLECELEYMAAEVEAAEREVEML